MGDRVPISNNSANTANILNWTTSQCVDWAIREQLNDVVVECIHNECIDGKCLLSLNEIDIRDFRDKYDYKLRICDIKRFSTAIRCLQRDNQSSLFYLGLMGTTTTATEPTAASHNIAFHNHHHQSGAAAHSSPSSTHHHAATDLVHLHHDVERVSPPLSIDGRATCIQPEFFKTMISLGKTLIFLFCQ